jgi:hypothetical protein
MAIDPVRGAVTTGYANTAQQMPMLQATAIGGLVGAIGFLWLFRAWVFDGGDGIWGDQGDARLLIAWLEHWYRWFAGADADWRSPLIFFPERNTLGYSDAYFLYALPYSALRALRIDPFTAFMEVMASLSVIGFASFMRLAICRLDASAPVAALGAFLFAFANMMAVKSGNAQSYCSMLLPVVIDLVAAALESRQRRAIVFAGLAGLLHAFIFFTAYLTGWFFAAFVLFAGLFYALLLGSARGEFLRLLLVDRRDVTLAYTGGFLIGILPFLALYAPILLEGRWRNINDHRVYAPWITDIINVGRDNLVWGRLLEAMQIANQPKRPLVEVELGYSPGVFATWLALTVVLFAQHRRTPVAIDRDRLLLACGIVLISGWLVQLNWFGLRPWRLIYVLVPGAAAVRTTFRAQIVVNLVACILVVVAIERLRPWLRAHRIPTVVVPTFALALMIEQINIRAPRVFSRAEQLSFLADVPAPPPACHAFYLVARPTPASAAWYVHQSDATLVAERFGIPTINGNSSNWPRGWRLNNPYAPDYHEALTDWIRAKGIDAGLCGLEPRIGRWVVGPP